MSTDQEVKPQSPSEWVETIKRARLAMPVSYDPPEGWVKIPPEQDFTLKDVKGRIHLLGIDGRWCPVVLAVCEGDVTEVWTPPGYPVLAPASGDHLVQACRRKVAADG